MPALVEASACRMADPRASDGRAVMVPSMMSALVRIQNPALGPFSAVSGCPVAGPAQAAALEASWAAGRALVGGTQTCGGGGGDGPAVGPQMSQTLRRIGMAQPQRLQTAIGVYRVQPTNLL